MSETELRAFTELFLPRERVDSLSTREAIEFAAQQLNAEPGQIAQQFGVTNIAGRTGRFDSAVETAAFGFGDEIAGALGILDDKTLKDARDAMWLDEQTNPVTNFVTRTLSAIPATVGLVIGSAAAGVAIAGGAAAAGASTGAALGTIGAGAIEGGLSVAGHTNEGDRMANVPLMAAIGGAIPGAALGARAAARGVGRFASMAGQAAQGGALRPRQLWNRLRGVEPNTQVAPGAVAPDPMNATTQLSSPVAQAADLPLGPTAPSSMLDEPTLQVAPPPPEASAVFDVLAPPPPAGRAPVPGPADTTVDQRALVPNRPPSPEFQQDDLFNTRRGAGFDDTGVDFQPAVMALPEPAPRAAGLLDAGPDGPAVPAASVYQPGEATQALVKSKLLEPPPSAPPARINPLTGTVFPPGRTPKVSSISYDPKDRAVRFGLAMDDGPARGQKVPVPYVKEADFFASHKLEAIDGNPELGRRWVNKETGKPVARPPAGIPERFRYKEKPFYQTPDGVKLGPKKLAELAQNYRGPGGAAVQKDVRKLALEFADREAARRDALAVNRVIRTRHEAVKQFEAKQAEWVERKEVVKQAQAAKATAGLRAGERARLLEMNRREQREGLLFARAQVGERTRAVQETAQAETLAYLKEAEAKAVLVQREKAQEAAAALGRQQVADAEARLRSAWTAAGGDSARAERALKLALDDRVQEGFLAAKASAPDRLRALKNTKPTVAPDPQEMRFYHMMIDDLSPNARQLVEDGLQGRVSALAQRERDAALAELKKVTDGIVKDVPEHALVADNLMDAVDRGIGQANRAWLGLKGRLALAGVQLANDKLVRPFLRKVASQPQKYQPGLEAFERMMVSAVNEAGERFFKDAPSFRQLFDLPDVRIDALKSAAEANAREVLPDSLFSRGRDPASLQQLRQAFRPGDVKQLVDDLADGTLQPTMAQQVRQEADLFHAFRARDDMIERVRAATTEEQVRDSIDNFLRDMSDSPGAQVIQEVRKRLDKQIDDLIDGRLTSDGRLDQNRVKALEDLIDNASVFPEIDGKTLKSYIQDITKAMDDLSGSFTQYLVRAL